jgi:hypothetical protein
MGIMLLYVDRTDAAPEPVLDHTPVQGVTGLCQRVTAGRVSALGRDLQRHSARTAWRGSAGV